MFVGNYYSAIGVGEYTTLGTTVNAPLISGAGLYPWGIVIFGSDLFVGNGGFGTVGEYSTTGQTVNALLISGLDNSGTDGIADIVVGPESPPALYIRYSGNTVTLFWQNVSGWILQQNDSLAVSGGWAQNNNWTTINGTNYLNLISPTGDQFFRLAQP